MKVRKVKVHVWHVEMLEPPEPKRESSGRSYDLRQAVIPLPELNRFLYVAVGAPWIWYMRLPWTWQQWQEYLSSPNVQTWIAWIEGTPIGYFELEKQENDSVEIAYFGLIPRFIGKGHGRALLQDAIDKAWEFGGKRVWLHTCSLDHPRALDNYLARGFRVFREEDIEDEVPVEPIQPWESANRPGT